MWMSSQKRSVNRKISYLLPFLLVSFRHFFFIFRWLTRCLRRNFVLSDILTALQSVPVLPPPRHKGKECSTWIVNSTWEIQARLSHYWKELVQQRTNLNTPTAREQPQTINCFSIFRNISNFALRMLYLWMLLISFKRQVRLGHHLSKCHSLSFENLSTLFW